MIRNISTSVLIAVALSAFVYEGIEATFLSGVMTLYTVHLFRDTIARRKLSNFTKGLK